MNGGNYAAKVVPAAGPNDPHPLDAVIAVADLGARSGAKNFDIGYEVFPQFDDLEDDQVQAEHVRHWYAAVTYRGAQLRVEAPTPMAAADGLAARILKGGKCAHCGRTITLVDTGTAKRCVWRLANQRWDRTCHLGWGTGKSNDAVHA